MKQKILIAGLGLIGGSIAKAIRQSNKYELIGYDTNQETLNYASEHQIVHETATTFEKAAQQAHVIILAAPITETMSLLKRLDQVTFDHPVIVTDVASVKGSILETARSLTNPYITFIGGHPMAGSHKSGIEAAKEHLFENAIYVLIPTSGSHNGEVEQLKEILKPVNSRFITLQPDEHDEMTGVISHFPHLIAASLVHQAKKWSDKHPFISELAAGGFRDITRIASSHPKMWQDIFYHNGQKLRALLKDWIEEMRSLLHTLEREDKEDMIDYLTDAKQYRDGLKTTKRGAIPSFYDLYVDIKDQPGALALVVQMLAVKEISIKNIEILEIREDIHGVLRISVKSKEAQQESVALLQKHGYDVYVDH